MANDSLLEFASIEAVKQYVIAEMGVGVLPTIAVTAELDAGADPPWHGAPRFDLWAQLGPGCPSGTRPGRRHVRHDRDRDPGRAGPGSCRLTPTRRTNVRGARLDPRA